MRYQLLRGFDRAVTNQFEVIGVAQCSQARLWGLSLSLLRICLLIDISIYTLIDQITLALMFCLLNFDWGICLFVSYDVNVVPIEVYRSVTSKSDFNFPLLHQLASFPSPDNYHFSYFTVKYVRIVLNLQNSDIVL